MKIQYASDLHLEFSDNYSYLKRNPLKPVGDILVLAGDIGYLNDDNYSKHPFWDWASDNYRQVIVAVGNHELYKYYDLAKMPQDLVCSIRDNVKCYYDAVVRVENVDFIISTLWAKIPLEEAYLTERDISDFQRILYNGEKLTWDNFNREHEKCFHFIQNVVSKSTAEHIVVVTHHVPSFQLTSPDFTRSKLNGAFTVELAPYIETSPIEYWIYGHSHRNIDKIVGKTQCLSNQLGYVFHNEHLSFDLEKIIEF
jgi:predicted phosphodiesterase